MGGRPAQWFVVRRAKPEAERDAEGATECDAEGATECDAEGATECDRLTMSSPGAGRGDAGVAQAEMVGDFEDALSHSQGSFDVVRHSPG